MPMVDIIVPAYNAAKFLPMALESVLGQTFTDWHIVLVDDGSTDDTAAIAMEFQQRLNSRMTVVQQANHGLPAARNAAIHHSSAPILALLDADDIWLPNRLAESVKCFENSDIGLSYGGVSLVDAEGIITSTPHVSGLPETQSMASAIYARSVDLPCPTVSFRRACLEEVGYFDESLRASEDRDLWFRIALKFKVAHVAKVIALYRISPGAMTTDMDLMFNAQLHFIEKHRGFPGSTTQDYRRALSSVYRQRAETLDSRGNRLAALRNVLHALALHPTNRRNIKTAVSILVHVVQPRAVAKADQR